VIRAFTNTHSKARLIATCIIPCRPRRRNIAASKHQVGFGLLPNTLTGVKKPRPWAKFNSQKLPATMAAIITAMAVSVHQFDEATDRVVANSPADRLFPARIRHLACFFGRIEEGYLADFIVVRGRPYEDVTCITAENILTVLKDGEPYASNQWPISTLQRVQQSRWTEGS
jgi:hypothetical protein